MNDLPLMSYFYEFVSVGLLTVLTIVTPGPDFLIVVKNSLSHSRLAGIMTAFGISTAIWVHISYSITGIGLIISTNSKCCHYSS